MLRNIASQKWRVFAWDTTTGLPKTGDAANITGRIRIDDRIVQQRVLLQRKGRKEVAVLRRSRETLVVAPGSGPS